jgi:hypothetical protein
MFSMFCSGAAHSIRTLLLLVLVACLQDVTVDLAIAYVAVGIFAATVTHFTIGTHMLKAPGSTAAGSHSSSSRWTSGAGAATKAAAALTGMKQEELPLMIELPAAPNNSRWLQQQSGSSGDYLLSARPAAAGIRQTAQQSSSSSSSCAAHSGSACGCSGCVEQQGLQRGEQVGSVVIADGQQQQQPSKPAAAGHTVLAVDASLLVALQHRHSCLHFKQPPEQEQQQQQCSTPEPSVLSAAQTHKSSGSNNAQQQQQGCDWAVGERESLLGPGVSSSDSSCWVQLDLREKQQLPLQPPQHQRLSGSWWRFASSSSSSSSSSGSGKLWRLHAAGAAAGGFVWSLASPPLVGCMLAVGVGMLPLLRHQLFSPQGHLLLVEVGAVSCVGSCSFCRTCRGKCWVS